MRRLVCAVLSLACGAAAADGEVGFSTKPTVTQDGPQVKIAFTLSAPADVEVAVLDKDGALVRHLAAGVLGGPTPPPPPLRAGLDQQLTWDGRDDGAQAATGGPFAVRVRVGMSVRFGRIIGGSPYTGQTNGKEPRLNDGSVVVDGEGNLYVHMNANIGSHGYVGWPWHLRRFTPTGEYVRTLLPYPPSTDPAKAHGFDLVPTGDGHLTPRNATPIYPILYAFGNSLYRRVVDNSLVCVDADRHRLVFFKLDGSNALRAVPMGTGARQLRYSGWVEPQVALSPDGRYAYYSNVAETAYDGKKPGDISDTWPQGRIYRQDLTAAGAQPERFFDFTLPDWQTTKYWMPSAWDYRTAAAGIDVDAQGHVLVGDLVNQQVWELGPDGRMVSVTKVPWPDRVAVARKTGTLYVVSRAVSRGQMPRGTLIKITGRGDAAKTLARLPLTDKLGAGLAIDESGDVPVLWLSGGGSVVRLEDRGDSLAITRQNILNRDPNAITFVGYMDADPEAELVYVTGSGTPVWRYSGETGEGGLLKITAADLAIGPRGMIYTYGTGGWSGPVVRYNRDLTLAPLQSGKAEYGSLYGRGGRGISICGLDVDRTGRVFATWGSNECHVRGYDAEGQLIPARQSVDESGKPTSAVITGVSGSGGALRLDLAGNLYLLQSGRPKGFVPPKGFEKDPAYLNTTGTILKFGPEGGGRSKAEDAVLGFSGVLDAYPDCGPISGWNSGMGACVCTKPRFDVDGFGRLYIPNAITYTVTVVDNAGNQIVRFGHYGNFDAQGPQSAEPKPDIPLGWPIAVAATHRCVYVGDVLNHRVIRVDKTWAAEEKVDVK